MAYFADVARETIPGVFGEQAPSTRGKAKRSPHRAAATQRFQAELRSRRVHGARQLATLIHSEGQMQTPLQITIRHMAHSHALTARVREEAESSQRLIRISSVAALSSSSGTGTRARVGRSTSGLRLTFRGMN